MAASISYCKINTGYGIKNINQSRHLMNGHQVERKHSLLSTTPRADQKSFPSFQLNQRSYNISLLRSKPENARNGSSFKCRAEITANSAPVVEQIEKKDVNSATVVDGVQKEEELSRATLIWRMAKLPMYTVALIPVTVGTAAAYWQSGAFSFGRYLMILLSYVLVNVWVNLSNDVYDFDTGVDKNKKESVVNLFGSRDGINTIAWSILGIGGGGLISLALQAGNPSAILMLAAAVFGFFLYQCPPFRLSYFGVGEPLLFLAYGPLSTIAFYLLNSKPTSPLPVNGVIVWSSILVGLTTALILFCSHFHQIEDDQAVGKISPLVRLGTDMGAKVVKWSVVGLYSLILTLGFTQTLPFTSALLSAMTLPMANLVVGFVEKNHKDKSKIFMGKYFCVRLHTILGTALAAGLVLARLFAGLPITQAVAV